MYGEIDEENAGRWNKYSFLRAVKRNFLKSKILTEFIPGASCLLDNRVVLPVLFLASLCYLFWGIGIGIRVYDEGLFVYGATRILKGDIPYQDFWAIYPPGQFYVLALLFEIFSPSLMVGRIFSTIVHFLVAMLAYCLSRKLVPQRLAVLSWFLATVWFGIFGCFNYATPSPPSLVFSFLCCFFVFRFLSSRRSRELLPAGLLTGAAGLFRQDFGFYTFLSASAVIVWFTYGNPTNGESTHLNKLSRSLKAWAIYVGGVAVAVLPAAIYLVNKVPVGELFYDLVLWPATTTNEFRSLPYPAPVPNPMPVLTGEQAISDFFKIVLARVPFYFTPIVFAVTLFVVASDIRTKKTQSMKHWMTILLLFLGLSLFNLVRGRSDLFHLYPTTVPAMILLPSLFSHHKIKNLAGVRILLYSLLLLMILSLGHYFMRSIPPSTDKLVSLQVSRAQGIYLLPNHASNLQQAIRFIQYYVPPDEKIFVGNFRHDRININDIMFYFLAERNSGTKYFALEPGMATTRFTQREIINDLERNAVKFVVLWAGDEARREENRSGTSSGVTDLDDYIRARFRPVIRFREYVIFIRYEGT